MNLKRITLARLHELNGAHATMLKINEEMHHAMRGFLNENVTPDTMARVRHALNEALNGAVHRGTIGAYAMEGVEERDGLLMGVVVIPAPERIEIQFTVGPEGAIPNANPE